MTEFFLQQLFLGTENVHLNFKVVLSTLGTFLIRELSPEPRLQKF